MLNLNNTRQQSGNIFPIKNTHCSFGYTILFSNASWCCH